MASGQGWSARYRVPYGMCLGLERGERLTVFGGCSAGSSRVSAERGRVPDGGPPEEGGRPPLSLFVRWDGKDLDDGDGERLGMKTIGEYVTATMMMLAGAAAAPYRSGRAGRAAPPDVMMLPVLPGETTIRTEAANRCRLL
jgi:hypothetical protein